jgi:hypothetical protein
MPHLSKSTGPLWNPQYKHVLCRRFEKHGTCLYLNKCQYAHGKGEQKKWIKWQEEKCKSVPRIISNMHQITTSKVMFETCFLYTVAFE